MGPKSVGRYCKSTLGEYFILLLIKLSIEMTVKFDKMEKKNTQEYFWLIFLS